MDVEVAGSEANIYAARKNSTVSNYFITYIC
ncbi:MAG: hypothetical protein H6Q69_2170, partial [Firmicutes bacterium]|nr:hypothetical protein [Bacillota bacterium]